MTPRRRLALSPALPRRNFGMAVRRVSLHPVGVLIKSAPRLTSIRSGVGLPEPLKPALLLGRSARVIVLIGWVAFGMFMRPDASAFAHDILAQYIQHTAHLTADARHLDLELELTFFEKESAKERHAMDTNCDRLISTAEKESYLARLAPTLRRAVTLRVGGREVPLTPLYEPELDLLANNKTGPGHHCLRLFLFASTPPDLRSGDEIVIEDGLWPEAYSFGTMQTEGRDGFKLEPEASLDRITSGSDSKTKSFKIKCLVAPARTTTSPEARAAKASKDLPTSRAHAADPAGSPTK